jgi:outer membrane protein assembly factor BamE (lipoprotein component of BamABCDE complex)
MRAIIVLFAAFVLAGCVAGTKFTNQQVDQIQVGSTTESELLEIFGSPSSTSVSAGGGKSFAWIWSYSSIGGVRSGSRVLNVILDSDGVTKDYSVSNYTAPGLF